MYADKGENTEKTYYVTDMHGNVVQLLDESEMSQRHMSMIPLETK